MGALGVAQRARGRRGGGGGRRGARELSLQLLAGGAVQQPTASPDGERVVGSAMLPLATLAAHTSTPLTLPLLSPAAAAAAAAADGDAPAAADGVDCCAATATTTATTARA